jgi:flagellum-specific peptidoglycan hydrolase FlgJ
MAIMIATRNLRVSPNGDSTGVIASAGTKVEILDDTNPSWIHVRLLDGDKQPDGWVSVLAVDKNVDAVLGPLDKLVFAEACVRQSVIWGVSAHYVLSVAEARTRVTNGKNANGVDIGPFALSPSEWAFYSALPEFQLNLLPDDINDWPLQCTMFAVMTLRTQQRLADLIGDQPNASQLYFAQIVGTKAAIDGIRNTGKSVSHLIAAVSPADFQSEGLESARLVARYPSLLQGATADAALKNIDAALQQALDSTKPLILKLGNQILDTTSEPSGPSNEPDDLSSLNHQQFIEFVGQRARKAMKATGVPASVTVAQAIQETGWGHHTIGQAKNLFGIKGTGPAGSVRVPTSEFVNGRSVTVQANFAKYDSFEQGIIEHAKFFLKNQRYAPALAVKDDPNSFAREIGRAGYATDPNYAATLINWMRDYNLYRFDAGA